MIRVENIRYFILYQRSLNLVSETYRFCEQWQDILTKKEIEELRYLVVTIPMKIASSVSQQNMKVTFKELNEAKQLLRKLQWKVSGVIEQYDIGQWGHSLIADYHMQVLKLINAYFRKLSNRR